MKRVITYGTFDTLHYGHIRLLQRAKKLGDYLIVGLSTDEFNDKKGKKSYHNWNERKLLLESIRYVDLVIAEETWEQKEKDIELYKIDIFTIGDDWEGKFDSLSDLCNVKYMKRTPSISSSSMKKILKYV